MNRNLTFEEGNFYHIYNQGVGQGDIFLSDEDWKHFQRLMFFRNDTTGRVRGSRSEGLVLREQDREDTFTDICAYSLMPKHFNMLVREKKPGGISKFMGKLLTSYSKYVNMKYDRSGPLMCRPFRAKHVNTDPYLRWLISSIHLDPLDRLQPNWKEKGVKNIGAASEFIRTYPYSSYHDYFVTDRDEVHVISKESLPFFISDLEDIGNMLNTYHAG